MGKASFTIKEERFVIEEELTQVYVAITTEGDSPIGVQGWYHKTFPASKSVLDIVSEMWTKDNPLEWSRRSPKE